MKKCAFLLLGLALPVSAHAASWFQNQFAFGSNKLLFNSAGYSVRISTFWSTGIDASFYRDSSLSGWVPSAKLYFNRSFARSLIGITPIYYPKTTSSPSSAEGGSLYYLFEIPLKEMENSSLQIASSLSSIHHHLNGNFNETAMEIQLIHNFYQEFRFLFSGAGFRYDQSLEQNNRALSVLNQSDIAVLQALRPSTDFPDWIASFQFSRAVDPESQSRLFVGYSHAKYRTSLRPSHSFLAGMDFKITEGWRFDFGYNAWRREGDRLGHYYAITLRYVP
ncbi:MAG: hypothetical protein HY400_01030 [Elusimicrobia bacterium]|nr:hypothetical protein [Elusimicrobiota bacterium]